MIYIYTSKNTYLVNNHVLTTLETLRELVSTYLEVVRCYLLRA